MASEPHSDDGQGERNRRASPRPDPLEALRIPDRAADLHLATLHGFMEEIADLAHNSFRGARKKILSHHAKSSSPVMLSRLTKGYTSRIQ